MKKYIIVLILFLAIMFTVGCTETTTEAAKSTTPAPTEREGVCNFDWQYGTTPSIGQYYTAPFGYSYVVVNLYIQNEDDRTISTNPYYWNFVADGIKYSVDVASFSEGINQQTVEVGKGGEIEVQLVYLVKGNPMEASLEYTGLSQPNVQRIEHYPKSEV